MKFVIAFLLALVPASIMANQKVHSTVDPRVELISIVFRLAGNPEYNMKFAANYVSEIHAYFDAYKTDPVVNFAKELAKEKNMGFSKVMFLAVQLKLSNNRFSLIREKESNLIGKWDNQDAEKFVNLLNNFYRSSKFEIFYKNHKKFYEEATAQFDQSMADFDQKWYLDHYGENEEYKKVALGLGNGGANYGPNVVPIGQRKMVYAIMGSWTFNEAGQALFPKDQYLSYLIHEFNHSFVDHVLEEDLRVQELLRPAGEILLDKQRKEMHLEGYDDWQSLVNESLVRASVVRYMIDHKDSDQIVKEEILKQQKKGFLWIKDLVTLLGEYDSSRHLYPTFQSFYPKIITFFNAQAHQVKP